MGGGQQRRPPGTPDPGGDRPGARWFGDWNADVGSEVSAYVTAAEAAHQLPLLVAYNIPDRDCRGHAQGGATPDTYRGWISAFARGLGDRPAVVVIEPDALGLLDCPGTDQATRIALLRYATDQFRLHAPNTWAYLDAGNSRWVSAEAMAQRLDAAGVRDVRGFALNVSNFFSTAESVGYGAALNAALHRYGYSRPFVVDTSRNGNGGTGEWCNPPGRALGQPSQVGGGAELLLWVKVPGDSDGECGIAPTRPAGEFDPELAMDLINGG